MVTPYTNVSTAGHRQHVRRFLYVLLLAIGCFASSAQTMIVSTVRDTKAISLSIYNDGFAVVRERRTVHVAKGLNRLLWNDVPDKLVSNSIDLSVASASTASPTITIIEKSFQPRNLSVSSVLQSSIGNEVQIRRPTRNGSIETVKGVLLSLGTQEYTGQPEDQTSSHRELIVRTQDSTILLHPDGEIIVHEIPEGLRQKPSITWKFNSSVDADCTFEVRYMTDGVSWDADYVLTIDSSAHHAECSAWVQLLNESGVSFPNAAVQLVAGNVHRIREEQQNPRMLKFAANAAMGEREPETLSEYHVFDLPEASSISQGETKYVQLLRANKITIRKRLVVDPQLFGVRDGRSDDPAQTEAHARLFYEFENSASNKLGVPLPRGRIHVYQSDSKAHTQFLGEDEMNQCAVDERVQVLVGEAFDVLGTRTVKDVRQPTKRTSETTIEYSLRNRKVEPCEVVVREHGNGQWEITQSTIAMKKINASTAEITLRLQPSETKVFSVTTKSTW